MFTKSHLEAVFQAFIKGRFVKSQLYKLCKEKGVDIEGKKEDFVSKVMELYSPKDLAEAGGIIHLLRWYERLTLSILVSGPKTRREIVEHELVKKVFSRGVPEATFGIITPNILNQREASRHLSRKVSGLQKKHLLLMKKSGRRGIYSIHPWILPYFKERLPLPSEDELIMQIQEETRGTIQFFLTQFPPPIELKPWKLRAKLVDGVISELAEKMKKGRGQLRFGLPAVAVSSIAAQYYCEKKVELTQRCGREETQEMRIGNEAHEKLLEDTVKVKREKIWMQITFGVPTMVREAPLLGKYDDVIIVGVADSIYFDEGVPKLLLEYKFTKSRRPWRDYHVQARVYCLLLHLMGFNTERLKYALILAPLKCKGRKKLGEISKTILSHPGKDMIEVNVNGATVRIYITDFNIDQASQDLDWALRFWEKEREAIPTRQVGKCTTCEFNQTCPDSLATTRGP